MEIQRVSMNKGHQKELNMSYTSICHLVLYEHLLLCDIKAEHG